MPDNIVTDKLDSAETIFFQRELERIKAATYDIKYPMLKAMELFPISTDAGPVAETITYRQWDQKGMAKIIANYSDDLPRVDVTAKEFTSLIKPLGASYGYNVQEIRASRALNKNLPQRLAIAARKSHDQAMNKMAFDGDDSAGLLGLANNTNISDFTVTNGSWESNTPANLVSDLSDAYIEIVDTNTKGVAMPNYLVLPLNVYTYWATNPYDITNSSNITILDWFQKAYPNITFTWANEMATFDSGSPAALLYERSPDILTMEIPQPFEQFPVQERNLEFVINTHSRFGGIIVYYPLEFLIIKGI